MRHSSSAGPDPALARVLAGVRALILDADGVLVLRGAAIPGAGDALAELRRLGIPHRVVTNFSNAHRETLARRFTEGTGLPVDPGHIITAASAAAAHTRARHPGRPLYVIASGDALREWQGQRVLDVEAADRAGTEVAAVVLGDAGDALTFRELDVAFRHIRAGAEFLAMHRNPWWLTRRGPTLDSGALVDGLEFATGRRAVVAGKPSRVVFREALGQLRAELGMRSETSPRGSGRRALARREVAMVGDDLSSDIAGAQRAGLLGILVLTGKTKPEDLLAARTGRGPDGVAPSLRDVVDALSSREGPALD
jgi:HAD superfamily hydrolase (TIGR01450 family)